MNRECWENTSEKARLSAIVWAFPRGEIILGVLEMPGTPQKRKWTANHQISPETGKNKEKTNPTTANGSFLEGNEGNMEEIGGRTQSWKNF